MPFDPLEPPHIPSEVSPLDPRLFVATGELAVAAAHSDQTASDLGCEVKLISVDGVIEVVEVPPGQWGPVFLVIAENLRYDLKLVSDFWARFVALMGLLLAGDLDDWLSVATNGTQELDAAVVYAASYVPLNELAEFPLEKLDTEARYLDENLFIPKNVRLQ